MKKIAVTGASGYIGKNLCNLLEKNYSDIRKFSWKNNQPSSPENISLRIDADTNWTGLLEGVDCLIHLASIVHRNDIAIEEYYKINVLGTVRLAEASVAAGIKRFIFISSIAVNGYGTEHSPIRTSSIPQPDSYYAISKHKAELALLELAARCPKMELVIIRPSMVYGIGAPGNVARIAKWARFNLPFPELPKDNARNFMSISSLVDLISICIKHPAANGHIFLAADRNPCSTYDFIRHVCIHSGYNFWTIPIPRIFIKLFLSLVKRSNLSKSLYSSLEVDISDACNILGWKPNNIIGQSNSISTNE